MFALWSDTPCRMEGMRRPVAAVQTVCAFDAITFATASIAARFPPRRALRNSRRYSTLSGKWRIEFLAALTQSSCASECGGKTQ